MIIISIIINRYGITPRIISVAAKFWNVEVAIPIHYPAGSSVPYDFEAELGKIMPEAKTLLLFPGNEYIVE